MRYNSMQQKLLALETSCDESAVAVMGMEGKKLVVIANRIASQVNEHAKWGGVVPEIASRKHLEALPFLLGEVLSESKLEMTDMDAVAATVAPGLAGALMIGSVTARTLASLYSLPFIGIHHLEGHLSSVLLGKNPPELPYLVLLVSGGHTELIRVSSDRNFIRLGRSHDDAAGEAFDKVARLLGLPYPGGPAIENLASKGDPKRFVLPKGRVSRPEGGYYPYDFSFSGLKTAMLRLVESLRANGHEIPRPDLAASFENIVAEVLVERSLRCAVEEKLKTLVMVGGVAANNRLREMMKQRAFEEGIDLYLAPKAFCTDNAAMIGAAALMRLEVTNRSSSIELGVSPRWPLAEADSFYQSPPPF